MGKNFISQMSSFHNYIDYTDKIYQKIYEFLLYNKLKLKVKMVDINLQILKISHFL